MLLDAFIERHLLSPGFRHTASEFYGPLARWIDEAITRHTRGALILGINGAQGTGKSTLSEFLAEYLESECGRTTAILSLDDLYLTHAERQRLGETVHPLLATRGVPGTHDVELGIGILDGLRALGDGERLALPRFDKAVDDRRPNAAWPIVEGPLDLVIFEGWCVCSVAAPEGDLEEPVNALEAREDPDGRWRRYVNTQLASAYTTLYSRVDALLFLAAPGFEAIRRWRLEQERKLIEARGTHAGRVMDKAGILRFIEYFERITRRDLAGMPSRADVVLRLDNDHAVISARYHDSAPAR